MTRSRYYFDNGASNWKLTQNVATNSPTWPYVIAGYNVNCPTAPTAHCDAVDITVDHLWYRDTASEPAYCKASVQCAHVDAASIISIPPTAPLSAKALAIMAASGANPDDDMPWETPQ